MKPNLFVSLLALGVAGCASTPTPPDQSDAHPANAHATQGTVPSALPMLMNLTNMVVVTPVVESSPEHHHGHEQHDSKPDTEGKK